jgi:hypothetical protein
MVSETLTKSLLTAVGFSTGVLSLLVLHKLKEEDLSMTKIQLNPDATVLDFKVITAANFLMLLGFLMYIVGVVVSNRSLWLFSKAVGALFGLFYAAVLFRWWRRF